MAKKPQRSLKFTPLALVAAGLALLSACTGTKAAPGPPPPVPVLAATVEQKDVPVRVHAIGTVEAYSTVSVKTQITGELTGVYFKEGDDVRKGQLIFTLDKRPLEAELNRAQSNLAKDEAAAANARVQQKRYEALVKAGVVSKEQYDQLESSAQAADAAVAADKAAVENAKVQLIYCSIYSPINGTVLDTNLEVGEMAFPGTSILTLADLTRPWMYVYVNEVKLGHVKLGQKAMISVDSFPDKKFSGKVIAISNKAEFTPKTIQTKEERVKLVFAVKIAIDNPDMSLKPGMPADAEIMIKGN